MTRLVAMVTWRVRGVVAAILFSVLGVVQLWAEDPWLGVICYLGAVAMGVTVARGRAVLQWVAIILAVLPAELALMALVFETTAARHASTDPLGVLMRPAALEAMGMVLVAGWSTWLGVSQPNRDPL